MAALAAAALCSCAVSVDERTVFAPQKLEPIDGVGPNGRIAGEQSVDAAVSHGFVEKDGQKIAWSEFSRAGPARPYIVHCGGNASSRWRSGRAYALKLIDFGDVLLFDYPGFGDSSGEASTQALEAMRGALAAQIAAAAADRTVIYWGHSLGGFVCAQMAAADAKAAGVAFEASAANALDVADAWDSGFIGMFISVKVADGLKAYDNIAALRDFSGEILVLSGKKDRTLPPSLSKSLADGLARGGGNVVYKEFAGAGHSDIPQAGDFRDVAAAFFERIAGDVQMN
jgi:pimeloyl-ACP methyl ester carboxylesterase